MSYERRYSRTDERNPSRGRRGASGRGGKGRSRRRRKRMLRRVVRILTGHPLPRILLLVLVICFVGHMVLNRHSGDDSEAIGTESVESQMLDQNAAGENPEISEQHDTANDSELSRDQAPEAVDPKDVETPSERHTESDGEPETKKFSSVSAESISITEYLDSPFMICHALGAMGKDVYTNSMDAFVQNYGEGHRIFEVDMNFTSDDRIVLWHDWETRFCKKYKANRVPSYEEFMNSELMDKYEPMSLEKLLELMAEYPDVLIITDSKVPDDADDQEEAELVTKQFTTIVDTAKSMGLENVLGRFCVQIYDENMYEAIENVHHFNSYIFTVYRYFKRAPKESQIEEVYQYCQEKNIPMVTMRYRWWKSSFAKIGEKYGVKTALHTVNRKATAYDYFEEGVSAIYTDHLSPVNKEAEKK